MKSKGVLRDLSPMIHSSLICLFASNGKMKLRVEAEKDKIVKDPTQFLELMLMYVEEGLVEKNTELVETMKRAKLCSFLHFLYSHQ